MNVVIRCDYGESHGLGHAVRMKALATELEAREATVSFLTATAGLAGFVLPFPCCQGTDEGWLIPDDVYVIDTKDPLAQDDQALVLLRKRGVRVVRIDHPAATPASCDLLIIPNAHNEGEKIRHLWRGFQRRLRMGWTYVMLAPEVTRIPPLLYEMRKQHGPVVFCAGGGDPSGALAQMIEWTSAMTLPVEMHFVLGADMSICLPAIIGPIRKQPAHIFPPDPYRDQLRQASLVVGMFGMTPYECLWYRTPMLMFAHTDENRRGADALHHVSEGRVCAGGMLGDLDQRQFCNMVMDTYAAAIHGAMKETTQIDGYGTQRVANAILAL